MSQKRNHSPKTKAVMCSKCNAEAVAPPGTKHRRCSGQEGVPIRPKYELLAKEARGTWN